MINPFNFPFFVFTKPSLLSSFPGDLQSSKVGAETRWSDQRGNNVSSNQILDKTPVLEPPLAMSTMRESIDWLFALKMPLHFLCTYWTVCHQIEIILAHMSSKVLNIARGTTDQGIESITQIIPTAEACNMMLSRHCWHDNMTTLRRPSLGQTWWVRAIWLFIVANHYLCFFFRTCRINAGIETSPSFLSFWGSGGWVAWGYWGPQNCSPIVSFAIFRFAKENLLVTVTFYHPVKIASCSFFDLRQF